MSNYVFENFTVSDCNEKGQKAAYAFASTAGEKYNPLIICGNNGTGKTHLAQAIAAEIVIKYPESKCMYITTEKFTNEVLEVMMDYQSAKKMQELRKKYIELDVLIIDDLDWLQEKEATQSELFFIIDTLLENGKKIVVTSGICLSDLFKDSSRIKSRLEAFHYVALSEPDEELILKLMSSFPIVQTFNDNIKHFIVGSAGNNIRKIQGMLRTIEMHYEINENSNLTLEAVESLFEEEKYHGIRINLY